MGGLCGEKQKVLVLIPARYASTRFPGKPLAKIAGQSMIHRVFHNCSQANSAQGESSIQFDIVVVTDSQKIEGHVRDFGGQVIRVDDDVPSGTERVYLGWKRWGEGKEYKLIVNVQGDEPLFKGRDLRCLVEFHLGSNFDIGTMVSRRTDLMEWSDPNRVKVVWNAESGNCFYFSRARIPFDQAGGKLAEWWLHIGVYSYRPKALSAFYHSSCGVYEKLEKLEQLRALESGLKIGACEIERTLVGVDVPEDIQKVEECL